MARRSVGILTLWMSVTLWPAPPLTTIQDVLYKADGTPFRGTLFIEWKSFEAVDYSTIATHSLTVPVVNGVLRVQLVPTTNATPPATYTVRYSSDGRIQFTEVWSVPPSATVVRLKDVRVASSQPGGAEPPPPPSEILISDVEGLAEELALRPTKGASYAPSRAVYIGASGALEAVNGNLSDCVRVDGTAGPCGTEGGSVGPGFTDGETPAGLINGSNVTFTLAEAPNPSTSLGLYRNGLLQRAGTDYTLSGNVITFATAATPQVGDQLLAYYRVAGAAAPLTEAGGALTGTYPDPQIAGGVISDFNIAANAGIQESKLALNYPTHSSANDPTAEQKAALGGSSGAPSATNRYVTSQDPRLSDARPPVGHALLGDSHNDSTAGTPARGDLVVAQGTLPATWKRLPLGAANRCLTSNGSDAVWNACLFTGFTPGAVPFVDGSGNLAQNAGRLFWDNANRRLSVGNNLGLTTVYVYDATPGSGVTGLTVRGGQNQGSQPLQSWQSATGAEVGYVDAAGTLSAVTVRAGGSPSRAAWQETGVTADPSTRGDGDSWYHATQQARKGVAAGRVHTLPQVWCASTGGSTSSSAHTRLGSCTLPAGLLQPGDRVEIRFDFSHEGSETGLTVEVRWGSSVVMVRSAAAEESKITGRAEAGVHGGGTQWSVLSWGVTTALNADAGQADDSPANPLTIDFLARMDAPTTETVTLRNFTVVRYPAQSNP
jgi:hypothetical protein